MRSDSLLNKTRLSIELDGLFSKTDTLVVGISGGADSIFLVHALMELGYLDSLVLVYCDHHLRSHSEIDYDQECIRSLIAGTSIPFFVKDVPVRQLMELDHQSLETAARCGRMAVFKSICQEKEGAMLVLGHHQDDVCETFFHQLLRGARTGLNGIQSKRVIEGCCVVRPLLKIKKKEIVSYLNAKHIHFSTDSTNFDSSYTRNKYRHELMPVLESLAPSYQDKLSEYMSYLEEWKDCERALIKPIIDSFEFFQGGCRVPKRLMSALPIFLQKRILYELITTVSNYECETMSAQIDVMVGHLAGYTGFKMFSLPGGYQCRLDQIYIDCIDESVQEEAGNYKIELPESVLYFSGGRSLDVRLINDIDINDVSFESPDCGYVDIASIDTQNLFVRYYQEGDRFWPYGMPCEMALKDFFSAQKIPKTMRDSIPLVFSNTDLLWVGGYRISERVKLTASTTSILSMSLL